MSRRPSLRRKKHVSPGAGPLAAAAPRPGRPLDRLPPGFASRRLEAGLRRSSARRPRRRGPSTASGRNDRARRDRKRAGNAEEALNAKVRSVLSRVNALATMDQQDEIFHDVVNRASARDDPREQPPKTWAQLRRCRGAGVEIFASIRGASSDKRKAAARVRTPELGGKFEGGEVRGEGALTFLATQFRLRQLLLRSPCLRRRP